MLPPLGPMVLGTPSGQPVATTATEGPAAKPFADNMLALRQVASIGSSHSRELDHNLDPNLDHNLNHNLNHNKEESGQSDLGLEFAQADAESTATDALHPGTATTLENYDLAPVNPLENNDLILPEALPPSGSVLPLAPLTSVTLDVDPNLSKPLAQDGLPRLDNALSNVWGNAVGNSLDPSLRNIPIAGFDREVGAGQAGVTAAGIAASGADATRMALQGNLHKNEAMNPSSELLNAGVNLGAAALLKAAASAKEAAFALTSQQTTPAAMSNLISTAATDPVSSLLASKDAGLASLRGGSELPAMPATGITPGQLSQRLDPVSGNVPVAGATQAKPNAEAPPAVLPNAGTVASTPTPTPTPAITADLSGVSSQLAMSAAASALTDKVGPAVRSTGSLPGSNGRREGLAIAAGNRIDLPVAPVTVATVSTQLRAELANAEPRQLAPTSDSSLLTMSGSVSTPTEGGDPANPSTSGTTSQINLQRSAMGTTALPNGLMSTPANGRLDVSDGMGGQWVGRLSQMIAQQQLTGQSLRIALSPAELGALELTFSGASDNWSVSLSAQQGQTRELLESHLDRIRAMLQDLGHRDAQVSLSDRWNGGGTSSGQQQAADSQTAAEQNSGWQHSPAVARSAGDRSLQANLATGSRPSDAPIGVDAYV